MFLQQTSEVNNRPHSSGCNGRNRLQSLIWIRAHVVCVKALEIKLPSYAQGLFCSHWGECKALLFIWYLKYMVLLKNNCSTERRLWKLPTAELDKRGFVSFCLWLQVAPLLFWLPELISFSIRSASLLALNHLFVLFMVGIVQGLWLFCFTGVIYLSMKSQISDQRNSMYNNVLV